MNLSLFVKFKRQLNTKRNHKKVNFPKEEIYNSIKLNIRKDLETIRRRIQINKKLLPRSIRLINERE